MKSIFDSAEFIEELLKVAQQKAAPANLDQLKNTATKLIDNLKQEMSPARANSNPTFSDLRTIETFSAWAKASDATYGGQPVTDPSVSKNPEPMAGFLIDLRKKATTQKGLYGEAIANLISQINTKFRTNIAIYEPAAKPITPVAPAKPGTKPTDPQGSDTANHVMVGVKIGPDGLPIENDQKSSPATGRSGGAADGINILDGMTVDFDVIYQRISGAYGTAIGMEPKTGPFLNQIRNKISNIKIRFDQLTTKTPNLNSIAAEANTGSIALIRVIESSFNTGAQAHYSEFELAQISRAFSDLMVQIGIFYAGIRGIPSFTNSPEIQKQIEWANLYSKNFMEAARQFESEATKRVQIR